MTKLPNVEDAIIQSSKLEQYLLAPGHPVGGFKAVFFASLGYSQDNWKLLDDELRLIIRTREVTRTEETRHGQKFIVESGLTGLNGRTVLVVTVGIILKGEEVPRFVTAYPRG